MAIDDGSIAGLSVAEQIRRSWTRLNSRYENQGWLGHHREIAKNFMPRKGRYLKSANIDTSDMDRGSQMNGSLLNSTGVIAARTLASGLMSGITSPARPWFKLALPLQQAKNQSWATRVWLYQVTQIMLEIAAQSNTYKSLSGIYEEVGVFGIASAAMEEDFDDVVSLSCLTIGEYRVATDAKGKVNRQYRQMVMTVMQMVEKFGKENVSDLVAQKFEDKKWDDEYIIIHAVEPNPMSNPFNKNPKSKPFVSTYIQLDEGGNNSNGGNAIPDNQRILKRHYLDYFPYLTPRWAVIGPDPYGHAPGMNGLPEMKSINHLELRKAQLVDRLSAPPMWGPPSLRTQKINWNPGGVTYVADPSGNGIKPIYVPSAQALEYVIKEIERKEASVKAAFYADLWMQMLESDRREMTAAEVYERRSEKMILLGPTLQQVEGDLLIPYLKFVFWRGTQANIFPDPPEEIAGQPVRIDFISVMHQALLSTATASIERVLGFVGNLAPIFPDATDNIDVDEAVTNYNDFVGAPPTLMRDPKVRDQARQAKAAAAERARMLEAAPKLATGAAALANLDVGDGITAASMA